jgi:hypothetical protein
VTMGHQSTTGHEKNGARFVFVRTGFRKRK